MAPLPSPWAGRILFSPDERLLAPSSPYNGPWGDALQPFVETMLGVLYGTHIGVGLSAVQIGVHSRICIIDVYARDEARRNPKVFVNPTCQPTSKRLVAQREGCLSVPGVFGTVERAVTIAATWRDIEGEPHSEELGGLLAHCLQHEIDHMDGVLFTTKRVG